ncbi:hypothetical protein [Mycobacterium colombiense]|uniref:Uncharacterized protein n=1 Tax=Mycobacterium colombiense TaxID=339268 RepID=A0A1A2ZBD9_9MYCO|nr:hypothetical protein [Mycobacterium colombiense]OBI46978.1 hypothetical protein A5708_12075 [Mycobacterium colombiense]
MSDTATDTTDATIDAGAAEADAAADDNTEAETEAQDAPEADTDDGKPNGREARYRKRAQEAEATIAARDAAIAEQAATIERLQRGQLETAITAAGVKPAAVFAVAELKDLLTEDGMPDEAKITAAVKAARDQLGITRPTLHRQTGMRSGAGYSPPKKDGWVDAFRRKDD